MQELWVDKYRPERIEDYIFSDSDQETKIRKFIEEKSIPHLLLSGVQGVGKTALAHVLMKELDVNPMDIKVINASKDNGIDMIRTVVTNFGEARPWGDFRVIILDEADHLSSEAQGSLRAIMGQYKSMVRFILTANYPHMIIPALHSRCQTFHISSLDKTEFTIKMATILADNDVEFDIDILDSFVNSYYPDLRKTINTAQLNVVNGRLQPPSSTNGDGGMDWMDDAITLFKQRDINAARKVICSKVRPNEYEQVYRYLFDNLPAFGDTSDEQDEAVLIIRNGMVKHTQVADPEINLSATMIELSRISKQQQ